MTAPDRKNEDQHYVPQVLLRNFGFKRKKQTQIFAFDKHKNCQLPGTPNVRNLACEQGFYEFHYNGKSTSLEPYFTNLEGNVKNIFDKIIAAKSLNTLDDSEKTWLSFFIAIQYFRTLHFREIIKYLNDGLEEKIIKLGLNPDEVDGFQKIDQDDAKLLSSTMFTQIRGIANILSEKIWMLYQTDGCNPFYISDNPVTFHNTKTFGIYGNLGFAAPGIQIHLPLSSNLTLALWCPSLLEEFKAGAKESAQLYQQLQSLGFLGRNIDVVKLEVELATAKANMLRIDALLDAIDSK